jgi:integrase
MNDNRLKAWVRKSYRTKDLHPSKQRWEVIWTDPHANPPYKQRTKGGFPNKSSAQAWANDFLREARNGTYTDPDKAEVTFRDLAQEWMEHQSFKRLNTASHYRRIIEGNNDLMRTFGDMPIGEITYTAVLRYIKQASDKLGPQTLRHRFYVLRTVLDFAVDTKRLPVNVAQLVKPNTLPSVRKMEDHEERRYPLTLAETERIIAALPHPYDMFTRLVAYTGMRPEEATGLRLRDVDLDDEVVKVRGVIVESQRELIREEATKTKQSRRDVGLDSRTYNALSLYVADHKRRAATWFTHHPEHTHPGEDLPLFVGIAVGGDGGRSVLDRLDYSQPMRYGSLAKHWRRALGQAEVPRIRFYELRHADVSRHVDRLGQDGALTLTEIQERYGHNSAKMTLDRYARASKRDKTKHRSALDGAVAPAAPDNVTPISSKRTGTDA